MESDKILDVPQEQIWKSNYLTVSVILTIFFFGAMVTSFYLNKGRSVYLYFLAFILTLFYHKIFASKLIIELTVDEKGVHIIHFDKFRKKHDLIEAEDLSYSLEENQVSSVTKALKLKLFGPNEELICYASEQYFLWPEKDLTSMAAALNEFKVKK